MSKITVTTIAGATSGADANKVKIESGDTLQVESNATVGGTLAVTGATTTAAITSSGRHDVNFNGSGTQAFKYTDTGGGNLASFGQFYNPSNALIGNIQNANNDGIHLNIKNGSVVFSNTGYTAANALDDYEEGSWTPYWANGTGQTYNTRVGRYTKIGNLVMVTCNIITSSMNSQTGDAHVGGLPFPVVNVTNYYAVGNVNGDNNWDTNLSTQNLVTLATGGQSVLRPRYNSGLNTSDVRLEHIGGGNSYFSTTVTYHTD